MEAVRQQKVQLQPDSGHIHPRPLPTRREVFQMHRVGLTWRKWRGCDYCLERCTVWSGGQSSHSAQLQHCRVLFKMTFLAGLITIFHAGCFPGMIYSHSAWAQSSISLSSWALPPAAPSRYSAVFDNSIGDYAFVWAAKNNLGHFPYHFLIILIPQLYIKIINHIEISVLSSKSCEEVSKLLSNARVVVDSEFKNLFSLTYVFNLWWPILKGLTGII